MFNTAKVLQSSCHSLFKSQRHQDQCPLLTTAEVMQKESAFGQQFIYVTTRGKNLETGISKNRSTLVPLYISYNKQQLKLTVVQEHPFLAIHCLTIKHILLYLMGDYLLKHYSLNHNRSR